MAKAKKGVKKKNQWLMLVISFCVFLLLSVIGGYFALLYAGGQMIDKKLLEGLKTEPSVVYDKDGKEIGQLTMQEQREYIPITDIPPYVVDAFVAVEDKRFFEHNGVDMVRIAGAILKDIRAGAAVEGGSTITQQLAKNVFLSHEKTFWRKTKEVSIAIGLERNYTKQQIMEMYLNKIYLGHGIAGVETAAQFYFGKSFTDKKHPLTIAEAATLAAIPKAPSYYSPFNDPARAKERRDTILRLMYEQNYITKEQKEAAQKEPLPKRKDQSDPRMNKGYQAYMDYVIKEAEKLYGIQENDLYLGGYKIYTAFDPKMQDAMIKEYSNPDNFPKNGATQKVESGMIVLDPKTGGIAAMMGRRNYEAKGYNLATDMRRQPGSSFKPIAVYAPAIDAKGYSIYSQLSNKRQSFNGYQPKNSNGRYSETISMIKAVEQSDNIPAVWLLNEIGVTQGMDYIKKFGIPLEPEDRNLAIALGGLHRGTSPLQMAQAYTAFANGGVMSKAHAITRLEAPRIGLNKTIDVDQEQVIKPKTAWDIHKMLVGVVNNGTGKAAKAAGRPVAGKTGSTESEVSSSTKDNKDVWFVGYTPQYVGAVWMGFEKEDKQNVMRGGSSFPAKMFAAVMKEGLKGVKAGEFTPPDGIQQEEEEKQVETSPLQLTASLTMEQQTMKVLLSWIGGEGTAASYDIYRYVDSPDAKELVASNVTDTVYVDSISQPLPYKYIVIPKDKDGNQGAPSNSAPIDTSMLDKLLEEGKNHDDRNPQGGNNPGDGSNNGDGSGNVDGNGGADQSNPDNPGDLNQQPDNGGTGGTDGGEQPGEWQQQPGDSQTPPPEIQLPPTQDGGEQQAEKGRHSRR